MNPKRVNSTVTLALCCLVLALQSCVGWGDAFAERRKVVGPYFLMTSDGGYDPQYYLFKKGTSGSITGPIKAIGWNQNFLIVRDDSVKGGLDLFAINPQRKPLPEDEPSLNKLRAELPSEIHLLPPDQVWNGAR